MRHVGGVAGDEDEGRGEVHRVVGLVGGSEEITLKWSRDLFCYTTHVGPRKHVQQHLARARQVRKSCLQQGWEHEHASQHLMSYM